MTQTSAPSVTRESTKTCSRLLGTDSWLTHSLETLDQRRGARHSGLTISMSFGKQPGVFIAEPRLEPIAESLNDDSKECAPALFGHRVAQETVGPGFPFEAALKQFSCRGTCQRAAPASCE